MIQSYEAEQNTDYCCPKGSPLFFALHFYSYLQDTIGNSTGFTYETIEINYVDIFSALQSKRIDFIYSSAGNIGCAIAEDPGLSVIVSVGEKPYQGYILLSHKLS